MIWDLHTFYGQVWSVPSLQLNCTGHTNMVWLLQHCLASPMSKWLNKRDKRFSADTQLMLEKEFSHRIWILMSSSCCRWRWVVLYEAVTTWVACRIAIDIQLIYVNCDHQHYRTISNSTLVFNSVNVRVMKNLKSNQEIMRAAWATGLLSVILLSQSISQTQVGEAWTAPVMYCNLQVKAPQQSRDFSL